MDDPVFQRVWRDTFLIHPTLRVPWKVILGNHDYQVRVDVFGVGCCCWLLLLVLLAASAVVLTLSLSLLLLPWVVC